MSSYTVHERAGCKYVTGSVPISEMAAIMAAAGADHVISSPLAELLGASLAWGAPADVQALLQNLRAERDALPVPAAPPGMSEGAYRWALRGEHGLSSAAILLKLTGYRHECLGGRRGWSHPYDADDLRRCMLLLRMAPELRDRIGEMRECSKEWAALAGAWRELEALLIEELPDWESPGPDARAPRTCSRMDELLWGRKRAARSESTAP